MPTVLDVLRTHLIGDEAATQLEQTLAMRMAMLESDQAHLDHIESKFAQPSVSQIDQPPNGFEGLLAVFLGIGLTIGKVILYVDQLPPSPGYEPWLIEAGWNRFAARAMAKLAVRHGRRRANESKWRRPVFDAIRFLGERKRQRRAIFGRAKLLLEAWDKTSIIETIFDEASLSETEFMRLLKSAVEGREADCQRITEIAAIVTPCLSLNRGPKVSAPSAAHELFLQEGLGISTKRRTRSRHSRAEEYLLKLSNS